MAKGIGRREMFGLLGASMFAQQKRPNILFIYTDDHSYRTVSCYPQAYKWVKTPAIDKLATEGVRFEHAYISTWCMPSRTMLLTGRHPHMAESMRMEGPYPGCEYDAAKCPFWPADFRKQGYFTGQIGKWHTGTDTGYGRDWDYQLVWNRPKFTETSTHYYYDQPITYHGGKTEILKRYSTDQYADWASEFIRGEGRDKAKPWYLWLCIGAVHGPYTPAPRHLDAYPGVDVETPKDIFPPRATKPDWAQKISQWNKDENGRPVAGGKTFNQWVRQYHQGVNAIDEAIEKVIKTLESTGQRENTLIVFTADQGLAFGQHGFRGTKVAPYDANIRAPFIISMPSRLPKNKVCKTPVGGIDIPATIYSFAGLKTPWEFQGRDLTPLLKNPDMNWPHPVMIVATGQKYGSDTHKIPEGDGVFHGGVPWYVMLRDKQYKYIRPMIHDLEELYDLEKDPDELNNLAIQPAHRARLLRMRAAALVELKKNKAGFVDKLPAPREAKG